MRQLVPIAILAALASSPSLWACDPGERIGRINRRLGAGDGPVEVLYQGWGFPRSVEVSNYDGDCFPWVSADGRFLFFASSTPPDFTDWGGRLTLGRLLAHHGSPENGSSDIYWVDAGVIESLRRDTAASRDG